MVNIRFLCNYSSESKEFIYKSHSVALIFSGIIAAFIFAIPVTIVSIITEFRFLMFLLIPIILLPVIFAVELLSKSGRDKYFANSKPEYIDFDSEGYCEIKIQNKVYHESPERIKKIVEHDEFYYIVYNFPKTVGNLLLQKNSVIEGTIEEFEKLFEDKIVKNSDL